MFRMRFGSHVSIANQLSDAINRAQAVGCQAMQIFPGNPRGWKTSFFTKDETAKFKRLREDADLRPLAIHLPYLVNLGSPVDRVFEASIASLKDSLDKAKSVDADFLVVHTGSHVGAGYQVGLDRIKAGLENLLATDFGPVKLLLENTSGAGYTLGARLEDIHEIFSSLKFDQRLGLCLDTCHAYAAGYNLADQDVLSVFISRIDKLIGLKRLSLIHANDCKSKLGSQSDRHEHIGKGSIGLEGFRHLLRHPALKNMTYIIETPRSDPGDDKRNLEILRSLATMD